MKTGFVLLSHGNFGGAQKRYLNLFFYLNTIEQNNFHFFLTEHMLDQIRLIYPYASLQNIHVVEGESDLSAKSTLDKIKSKTVKNQSTLRTLTISVLKKTWLYDLYFFHKTKKRALKTFIKIDSIVKKENIKVLMGIYSGIIPLYFYLNQKTHRPKIIFSNMDSWFSHISEKPIKEWYKKYDLFNYAHTNSDHIDFLSPFILNGIVSKGIPIKKNTYSITSCSFSDYSLCGIKDKSKIKIVFCGRLEKDKNPILFFETAVSLATLYNYVDFLIIGEGRLYKVIFDQLQKLSLPNIQLIGFHKQPTEILASSLVFVSLQKTNNYPSQSVLEAMACGNAIIATDVGDTRLFVNEDIGTLINSDTNSLRKAIEEYILNPSLAVKKGKNAANFVKSKFTIDKASSYYMNLFNSISINSSEKTSK